MSFYCKYCGRDYKDIKYMLTSSCAKSPTKKHVAYEGNHTDPFICKHCGKKEKELRVLVNGYCSKSPSQKHEPL